MKERNLLIFYNGSSEQWIGLVMAILAPFAASVEVFLRKDMGVRYFTFTNFIAGLIVIWLFRIIYAITNSLSSITASAYSVLFGSKFEISVNTNVIYWVWLAFHTYPLFAKKRKKK